MTTLEVRVFTLPTSTCLFRKSSKVWNYVNSNYCCHIIVNDCHVHFIRVCIWVMGLFKLEELSTPIHLQLNTWRVTQVYLSSIQHKNLIPYSFVAYPSQMTWNKLISRILRLIPVSNQPKLINSKLHTIWRLLCWMNVRYTGVQ